MRGVLKVADVLLLEDVDLPEAIHRVYGQDPAWEARVRYRIERETGQQVEAWNHTHPRRDVRRLVEDLDL